MGNGFGLKIGMTTQQILSNINRMNTTDKTKQNIFNFCKYDSDGKITNIIELTMLESWANGSEKVPMPKTLEQYDGFGDGFKEVKKCSVTNGEPGNKDVLIDSDKDGFADSRRAYTTKIGQNNGRKLWLFEDKNLNGILEYNDFWDLDEK